MIVRKWLSALASWDPWPRRVELEPTPELNLIMARAVMEFMDSYEKSLKPYCADSIWGIAEREDTRLDCPLFPRGSEQERIWDMADTFSDFACEPCAYQGDEAQITELKAELIQWAESELSRLQG
jgi:hypothetical protein